MRDAIIGILQLGNNPKMMAFANAAWIRVSTGRDEVPPLVPQLAFL